MSWKDLYRIALQSLQNNPDAEAIAKNLIEHLSGKSQLKLWLETDFLPNDTNVESFHFLLNKLEAGEPLQYVLGYAYFLDMKLEVNSSVLIPRPETEELVVLVKEKFKQNPPKKVVDFCTGSACIALGIKRFFPDSEIIATDISTKALEVAKRNAVQVFGTENNIQFMEHNLLQNEGVFASGNFDLIVSNPPYIAQSEAADMTDSVLNFEPHIALFAEGNDPLIFYKKLIEVAAHSLNKDGVILCEINPIFSQDLLQFANQLGFDSEIGKDLSGKDRFWEGRRRS